MILKINPKEWPSTYFFSFPTMFSKAIIIFCYRVVLTSVPVKFVETGELLCTRKKKKHNVSNMRHHIFSLHISYKKCKY